MRQIAVNTVVPNTTFYEAGADLAAHLRQAMVEQEKVKLSLKGISGFSTSFMHGAFGQLIDEFGLNQLRQYLIFTELTRFHKQQLQDYFSKYSEAIAGGAEVR